jgi:hypothetical protein
MRFHRVLWGSVPGVFLLVAVLYLPTLRGGFVYDSIAQVLYSDYLHTPSNWIDVLTLRVVGQDELDRNRPLHLASLMLDAAIWGRNPFGYRLTSVLLHALNAALLFVFVAVVLWRRTAVVGDGDATALVAAASSPPVVFFTAAFGALVFALHPLVVEVVAEPSNREDLLVLLPLLIGLLAIVSPVRSRWGVAALLVVSSFFAVLAKESGVAVPLVFAVAAGLSGKFRSLLPGLIGGLLASLAFLIASYVWRPEASAILVQAPGTLAGDVWSSLAVQCRIWTLQLGQIIWPWSLSAHYPPQAIEGISLPAALIVLAVIVSVVVWFGRTNRLAALGASFYVLALLPASNFAAQFHPMADRYLYVPLAGVGLLGAALAHRLRMQCSRRFASVLLAAGGFVFLSAEYAANVRRQIIWQEPATMWTDVLRQFPRTAQARLGMANVHYRAGDFASARAAAAEAVLLDGGRWANAMAMRAICEWQTGNMSDAVQSMKRVASILGPRADWREMGKTLSWSPEQLGILKLIQEGQVEGRVSDPPAATK